MQISSTSMAGVAPPPPPPAGMRQAMQSAAKTLGLSDDDLRTQLRSGKTLADVASDQGISQDDLVASIADSLKTSGAQLPSGVDATQFAQDMVTRQPPQGPPPGPPPGDRAGDNAQSLADTLGIDQDELVKTLQSGDLSSLLKSFSAQYQQTSAAATGGLQVDTYG
jgi:uncharacterized protein YidB (DUF937 family)